MIGSDDEVGFCVASKNLVEGEGRGNCGVGAIDEGKIEDG